MAYTSLVARLRNGDSMLCNHECFMVGGPWISENPSCPIHGINAPDPIDGEEIRAILYKVWCREINADDAYDQVMSCVGL